MDNQIQVIIHKNITYSRNQFQFYMYKHIGLYVCVSMFYVYTVLQVACGETFIAKACAILHVYLSSSALVESDSYLIPVDSRVM